VKADEAQHMAQVGAGEIDRRAHRNAIGRERHIDLLALQQAFRTVGGIGERDLGAGDLVDPGLQGRRDREVVERRADHDHVRGLKLGDQFVGFRKGLAGGGVIVGRRLAAMGDPVGVEQRDAL